MSRGIKRDLGLSPSEKGRLRRNGIILKDIGKYSVDDLTRILNGSKQRAREVFALTEFQSAPSLGLKFAHDLIGLGFYSFDDLKDENAAEMFNQLEHNHGSILDPCVEDQCRLAVHYANNRDSRKCWWDFTAERKKFRDVYGYPATRPGKNKQQLVVIAR